MGFAHESMSCPKVAFLLNLFLEKTELRVKVVNHCCGLWKHVLFTKLIFEKRIFSPYGVISSAWPCERESLSSEEMSQRQGITSSVQCLYQFKAYTLHSSVKTHHCTEEGVFPLLMEPKSCFQIVHLEDVNPIAEQIIN